MIVRRRYLSFSLQCFFFGFFAVSARTWRLITSDMVQTGECLFTSTISIFLFFWPIIHLRFPGTIFRSYWIKSTSRCLHFLLPVWHTPSIFHRFSEFPLILEIDSDEWYAKHGRVFVYLFLMDESSQFFQWSYRARECGKWRETDPFHLSLPLPYDSPRFQRTSSSRNFSSYLSLSLVSYYHFRPLFYQSLTRK